MYFRHFNPKETLGLRLPLSLRRPYPLLPTRNGSAKITPENSEERRHTQGERMAVMERERESEF